MNIIMYVIYLKKKHFTINNKKKNFGNGLLKLNNV